MLWPETGVAHAVDDLVERLAARRLPLGDARSEVARPSRVFALGDVTKTAAMDTAVVAMEQGAFVVEQIKSLMGGGGTDAYERRSRCFSSAGHGSVVRLLQPGRRSPRRRDDYPL